MDAAEPVPQLRLQIPKLCVAGELPVLQVQHHLVVTALNVADALQRHGPADPRRPEGQGPEGRLPGGFDLSGRPGKDLGELLLIHRLEQVLERPHVKGVEHIPLVAGDEDDDRLGGGKVLPYPPGQGHPVRPRGVQGDVQKEQVKIPAVREERSGGGVRRDLAGAVLRPDQGGEAGAGPGFVVADGYF